MALPSNIWTGVPYLVSLVKFTNMSPTYLLLINILNKTFAVKDRPLQYSTPYWPPATVARIIKSCLETHSKACQWHEILLSEFWASRAKYMLEQLKATKVLRQHKRMAEVLQSSFIFLMQAGCSDLRAGRSWFGHVNIVTRPPFSIIPVQETTMISRPRQWLPFAFQEFTSYSWSEKIALLSCSQRWKSFPGHICKEEKCFKGPCLPAANKFKHSLISLPYALERSSKCFGHCRLNTLGSIIIYQHVWD